MTPVNQEFESAPMGRRVVLATAFSVLAFTCSIAVNLYFTIPKMKPAHPGVEKGRGDLRADIEHSGRRGGFSSSQRAKVARVQNRGE